MERDPNILLTNYIRDRAKDCGIPWDTYHADFLLGTILRWLDENDCYLSESGVYRN